MLALAVTWSGRCLNQKAMCRDGPARKETSGTAQNQQECWPALQRGRINKARARRGLAPWQPLPPQLVHACELAQDQAWPGAMLVPTLRSLCVPFGGQHTHSRLSSHPLLALAILYPAPQSELGLFSCHGIQLTNPGNSCPLGQTQLSHFASLGVSSAMGAGISPSLLRHGCNHQASGGSSRGRDLASH